jgi:hypothetical protein
MLVQRILIPAVALTALILSYRYYGWMGVATAGGLLVMWVLLHFTRLMHVLRRAAQRPIGYLDSAVMLNAKLKPGMTLMHVIALTRSLGQLQTERDAQPEVFRWTDPSQSWVECTFVGGRLSSHLMHRPATDAPDAADSPEAAMRPAAVPDSAVTDAPRS